MKRSICLTLLVILSVIALPLFAQSGRVVPLSEADALTVRITHVNMKKAVAAWEALRVKFGEKYLTVPYGDPESSGVEYVRPREASDIELTGVYHWRITERAELTEAEKKAHEEKRKKRAVFFRKGWDEHAGGSASLPLFEFSSDFRFMVPTPPAKTESTPAYRWWGDQPYLVPRW